jgi:hypothetical protein
MQNNPVPSPGMVKEACADFEQHVDILNNKMANSLSKLSKGGPRQGFDHPDLQQLPEVNALDTTIQTWRESTNYR